MVGLTKIGNGDNFDSFGGGGGEFRYLEIFDCYEGKVLTVLIVGGFDSFDSG